MRSAPPQPSSYQNQASLRRRGAGMLLAVIANALLILMLLRLAIMPPEGPDVKRTAVTLELSSDPSQTPTEKPKAAKARHAATAVPRSAVATAPPIPPPIVPPPVPKTGLPNMIIISRSDYAASDIAKMPSHRPDAAAGNAASASAGTDGDSDDDGGGTGPNGERLYRADWYRQPTRAEIDPFMPPGASPGSWGEVACRTFADYHVEDCQEVADSPPGSRLARAVRQAAWQFRVRPPRVGGKPIVGAWVRIRIMITDGGVNTAGGH